MTHAAATSFLQLLHVQRHCRQTLLQRDNVAFDTSTA